MTDELALEPVSRDSGIGGSDIAAIVGLSPHRTKWDVYADKRGLSDPFEPSMRMKMGKLLEPTICQLYADETGDKVAWFDKTIRHRHRPWIIGTPDGFVVDQRKGFEAKTAGLDQAWRWGENQDDVPEEYLVQCQWYMLLTGNGEWDLAALIGGDRFRIHHLEADEDLQGTLAEEAEYFWNECIVGGKQPDFDHGRAARAYVKKLYPTAGKTVREATLSELEVMRELAGVNKELSYLGKRKQTLVTRMESLVGPDYGVESREEGLRAIWYQTKESSYQVHRAAGRVFKLTDKRRGDDEGDRDSN